MKAWTVLSVYMLGVIVGFICGAWFEKIGEISRRLKEMAEDLKRWR